MLQQSQTNIINRGEYNGWSNRETWLVNLWLNNEPFHQESLINIIEQDASFSIKIDLLDELVREIALYDIKDHGSMTVDLINAAIARADLGEILKANSEA